MLTVQLKPKLEKRLNAIAQKTGQSEIYHIEQAILDHIEELEDIELAIERLNKPQKIYSSREIKRELGL